MSAPDPSALAEAQRLLCLDPARAADAAKGWLQAKPGDPRARLLLAAACRREGRPAEDILQALVRDHPRAWGGWYELGVCLALQERPESAASALCRAVELNPQSSLAASALSDQLALSDSADAEAEAAARRAAELRRRPALPALVRDADPGRSDWPARLSVAGLDPGDPVSLNLLAQVALDIARPEAAQRLLGPAIDRWPRYAALRLTLAKALVAQGRGPEAAPLLRALGARHAGALQRGLLAEALAQSREDEAAREVLEAMLCDRPDDLRAWIALGHVRKTLGDAAAAALAYREAIARAPHCGEAYASLANLKHNLFSAGDLAAMRTQLADPALDRGTRAHFHFALAKALEEQGDLPAAVEQYHRGNALRRADEPYDAASQTAFVTRTRRLLTGETLRARQDAGHPDPAPIFVVGLPRSGSTLVEQILACHPQVEGCDELPVLPDIARDAIRRAGGREDDYPASVLALGADDLAALGAAYMARTAAYRKLGRPRFVDKFPGNVLHLGLIALVLPQARIVDVRRDPESCCVSLYRQNFARGQAYSHDLKDLGRYYRDYLALMTHMDAALPRPAVRVRYEALVREPEPQIRRLLAELDLPFDAACLNPERSRRPVRTASAEQVRRPISDAGLEDWRAWTPWLEPLYEGLRETA